MRRREFLALVGGAAASPLAAGAQQPRRFLRVGCAGFSPRSLPAFVAFERGMAELGYHEGDNYTFDYVKTKSPSSADYEAGFREIVTRNPDILLAAGTELGLKAALAASPTVAVVMVAVNYDPFGRGYVANLSRPGGRITGVFVPQVELAVKRLQLLKDAIPGLTSAIAFYDVVSGDAWAVAEKAGAKLGLLLIGKNLGYPPFDYDRALAEVSFETSRTLCVFESPRFTVDRQRLAEFALRNRLVSMFASHEFAEAGGVMAYGPNIEQTFWQSTKFVDRIARGANPGDLPIEEPTKIEFVVNLATARKLQIEVPPGLLARADKVIE